MKNESIQKIIEFINELEAQDPLGNDQILDFAQWAGRLSSLGYETYLDGFFRRFDAKTINSLLKQRINEGLDDIEEAVGEYLGVEIFTVQDFVCFVNHAPEGVIDQDTQDLLDKWIEATDLQSLDEEASQTLHAYLDSYPIAEDDQIDIISAPLTDKDIFCLAKVLEPLESVIEKNSEKLQSQIHIEKTEETSDGTLLSIRIFGVDPEDVVKVRQLGIPAIRSKTDASIWKFDFEMFGRRLNVEENIIVQTFDGAKASVPYASIEKNISKSVPTPKQTLAARPAMVIAAAGNEKPEFSQMLISGLDVFLDISVDKSAKQVIVKAYSTQDNKLTDKLDGWKLFGKSGICFGSFDGKVVKYSYSEEYIPVLLEDKNKTSYPLTAIEEN